MAFILELKLQTTKEDDYELNKRFFHAFQIKNVVVSHCQHMLNKLKYDTEYRDARLAYHDAQEKGDEKARKSAASVLKKKVKETELTTKKKLSERWVKIGDYWIQRDLYSAFLLFCATLALGQIDRGICLKRYDFFKKLHDSYIDELVKSEVALPSCCGIHCTKKLAA